MKRIHENEREEWGEKIKYASYKNWSLNWMYTVQRAKEKIKKQIGCIIWIFVKGFVGHFIVSLQKKASHLVVMSNKTS